MTMLAACGGGEAETATSTATPGGAEPTAEGEATGTAAAGTPEATGTGPGGTEAAAGDLDEVCAQGAEEGSFTYWATFEPDNFNRIYEAFSAAHSGIEVDFLPLRPQEAVQRVLTASSAGQAIEPDLVNGNIDALLPLVDRDLIDAEVDWTSLGVTEDLVHPSGTVRIYRVPNGLAYNTDTTSPEDLPNTWEELIDEQYARDVVVDPRGNPFTTLAIEWGAEETLDYVNRLAETVDPIVIEGGTAGMTAVVSGEALISTGGRADSNAELQQQGAPIDIKYLDVVPTQDFYHALLADAESPNAALCFAGWLASPEGTAVHEEVEFKANETVPPGAPEDAVVVSIETPEDAELAADLAEQIGGIFGTGG